MSENKPAVLYVDDVSVNLILFRETFKNDFDITLTEFPHEALKIMEEKEIQVMVSDQRMPEMTGIELLEIVADKYPDIIRYLLTAYTDVETVIEAVIVGRIHGYIQKPFKADEIRATIKSSMEVYHLRKKNQQILKELEKVNAELLNLDGLKTEIIHSITNEISPPLNHIMGTLHLLKSKIEGDELSGVVNILDQSVFKLEQFSTLAQQISTLKSPGFVLDLQQLAFKQVVQYSIIETNEELKEVDIKLIKQFDSGELMVRGNSDLLVSCLVNLIRFAREHTERNGELVILTTVQEGRVECHIKDGGSNYSDTLLDILTDQFSFKDVSLNLKIGIGLAVSQAIMIAHKGHLVFEKTVGTKGKMKMVFPNE
ncbi:MAG: hybrid sensor histidine kinase/response regulator [Bacteroidales bacterium]|nr:hybrid sensor histidine kinase/response regulator [Bacteroidales bacterium]